MILLLFYFAPVGIAALNLPLSRGGGSMRTLACWILAVTVVLLAGALWLSWPVDEFSGTFLHLLSLFLLVGNVLLALGCAIHRLTRRPEN